MRTLIIGDIHGCSGALRRLLAILKPDESADRLVFLGDLFDRGPDSWGVYQMLQELAGRFGDRFVLLRGNHEDYLLSERLSLSERLVWKRGGKGDTVRSFKAHGQRMEDSIPWVRSHVVNFYRGEGFQCVHAGLKVDPIEANDNYTIIHDHSVAQQNRYAGPLTVVGHIALAVPTWFAGDGKTFSQLKYNVRYDLPDKGILCIDAGCGKGGRLVGMEIEDGRYILRSVGGEE